ncbi:MAG: T9SS type A sorting domain-containing protein [Bacteroidetes bacterium]|nr:T9SS type A sorting domain-containing protein [Bacteroidota bacterium]
MANAEEAAEDLTENLAVYPNPVMHSLHLTQAAGLKGAAISIVDARGRMVYKGKLAAGTVDVSSLKPGLYLIRISSPERTHQLRFIKQ